jgi:nitroreductase
MAVCDSRAIRIEGLSYAENIVDLQPDSFTNEQFNNFLASRRSVRNFKNQAIPDEFIRQIIESVRYAPYGSDSDEIELTVVNNRAKIEEALPYISTFYSNVKGMLQSPFMRFMMKRKLAAEQFNTLDIHLMPRLLMNHYDISKGQDNITRNAPALLIFHAPKSAPEHSEDALIFITYAALAAHALGLGATINGLVGPAINKDAKVREIFQVPTHHEAIISLIIGYPKIHFKQGIKHLAKKTNWL